MTTGVASALPLPGEDDGVDAAPVDETFAGADRVRLDEHPWVEQRIAHPRPAGRSGRSSGL